MSSFQGDCTANHTGVSSFQGDCTANHTEVSSFQGDCTTNHTGVSSFQGIVLQIIQRCPHFRGLYYKPYRVSSFQGVVLQIIQWGNLGVLDTGVFTFQWDCTINHTVG